MFQQLLFKNQKLEIKQINKNDNKQEYINKKGGSYMKKKAAAHLYYYFKLI